jgi:catechol 2,3-dioxygenase-like lactoylglutathione lyase family enzyme
MAQLDALLLLLGLEAGSSQYVPRYEAECIFARGSGAVPGIEFIVPRGGKLAKFNKGAGGLHHIALEVDDLDSFSAELAAEQVELLEQRPVDAGSLRINFLPPAYTRGIIVEFVERKACPDAPPAETQ